MAAVIVTEGVSGDIFDVSIAHAHALCSFRRTGSWLSILLLCMINRAIVTLEGRSGSVKGKGKLHAVGVEYGKYKASVVSLTLLYIWKFCPEYAPREHSIQKPSGFGCDCPNTL